jgi:hypothetical protein
MKSAKVRIYTLLWCGLLLAGSAMADTNTTIFFLNSTSSADGLAYSPIGTGPNGVNIQSWLSGLMLDAEAIFTTDSSGDLTVQLLNLVTDPKNVPQNFSGVTFTVGGLTQARTLTSSSGQLIDIDKFGNYSDLCCTTTPLCLSSWQAATTLSTITLTNLGPVGSGPEETIIGAPSGSAYTAGGSIEANAAQNPFVLESATFEFTGMQGVTANSPISNVVFTFGTDSNQQIAAVAATPEPSTWSLFGLGIAALVLGSSRLKSREETRD